MDLTAERKEACIAELFKLVHGHTKSLIFAHDTSRVIQTLMKCGTAEMRDAIFHELKGLYNSVIALSIQILVLFYLLSICDFTRVLRFYCNVAR